MFNLFNSDLITFFSENINIDLAKSRIYFNAREHAYTITKLTKQEKDDYLYLVNTCFNGEK